MTRLLRLGLLNRILNGPRLQRIDPISTGSCGNSKEPSQVDKKYALMTKKDVDAYKAHGNLIKIDKQEVLGVISGVPEAELRSRTVRIAQAVKNPMQSGTDNTSNWVLQFDTRPRWENPLMGWSSTGDPLSNMEIQFSNKEDAIEYCDKNGWEWFLESEKPKPSRVKNYGINFSWNKRTRVSTK